MSKNNVPQSEYFIVKDLNPTEQDLQIIQEGVTSYNAVILGERADHFVFYVKR